MISATASGDGSLRRKVLIIKTGHSETFAVDNGACISLGDVLRTTVILHSFPPETHQVTWIVNRCAAPLLRDNKFIEHLWEVDELKADDIHGYACDIVINLENIADICAAVEKIEAKVKCGFQLDRESGDVVLRGIDGEIFLSVGDMEYRRSFELCWSDTLLRLMGGKYSGQTYVLGYRPRTRETFDVGLNHEVGKKFPLKRWPEHNWKGLYERLAGGYTVSWQQGHNNLENYIDWINSCRTIVSNDSLGLHIAIALGKNVVALFGPTSPSEFSDYPDLRKIVADVPCSCLPLGATACRRSEPCMDSINIRTVAAAVESFINQEHRQNEGK